MSRLKLDVAVETLRLAEPFRISGHCLETVDVVQGRSPDGKHRGRGEASGVYYMHDDLAHMTKAPEGLRGKLRAAHHARIARHLAARRRARRSRCRRIEELESPSAPAPPPLAAGQAGQAVRPVRAADVHGDQCDGRRGP